MLPDSRSLTPDSQLTSSLHRVTTTIDELTRTLTSVSRFSSPEPDNVTTCCCGREDCEASRAWAEIKSKLESRLVLSAEVGRALLERHEALVRRQKKEIPSDDEDETVSLRPSVDVRVAELVKQNALLEKRLTQALMHTEMGEQSNEGLMKELDEARTDVARLSSQNARAVGLENRLAVALQEKDDLRQELDSATQRARITESRIVSYREKCAKLQAQVSRLRENLNVHRAHRQELSQEILTDAKRRLEQLQYHQLGHSADIHDTEVTKVLESLVADNEALKHDNAELQNLLTAEREELHSLQEELEERRASDALQRGHRFTQSGSSFYYHDTSAPLSPTFHIGTAPTGSALRSRLQAENAGGERRSLSVERSRELTSRRPFEPLTPETERRPLSPDSHIHAGSKWTSFAHPRSNYAPSHVSFEDRDSSVMSPERPRAQKPLLLLTRERGVQTDPWNGTSVLSPSPIPRLYGDHTSSHDGQSESSSVIDNVHSTAIGSLVERTAALLNRIAQADALTLTNRLKRQRLLGADVSHLSRSTVNAILNDANALRNHFRPFLEDEKVTTTCTRRDLRGLLKLVKDVFTELGALRVTLNDVILDPTIASKVSEIAMNPSKAQAIDSSSKDDATSPNAPSWIAPISKLLGLPGGSGVGASDSAASRALSPPARNLGRGRPPPRIAPKLQPALSASAMTVNVEFSGAAVGRAVTSTYSAHPSRVGSEFSSSPGSSSTNQGQPNKSPVGLAIVQPTPRGQGPDLSRSVMGIFAGAPRPAEGDPWVVIPRPPSASRTVTVTRSATIASSKAAATATMGRSSPRHATSSGRRLSRIVDAMIDTPQLPAVDHVNHDRNSSDNSNDGGGPPPALERALRRGLSDSSIHTTFTQHGNDTHPGPDAEQATEPADRESVLQALSRKVQAFRFIAPMRAPAEATASSGTSETAALILQGSRPQTPVAGRRKAKASEQQADASTPRSSPPRPIPRASRDSHAPAQAQAQGAGQTSTSLFGLSSWTAAYPDVAMGDHHDPSVYAGSPRQEPQLQRNWTRERGF
ncbi:hypothetical protein GSI_01180 [Ganoderma sinense ZZ0214-1]|uniref:Uncharacterized protein n=1 Tax=Ganoderma sinense ZZ0214-1 TaxID=1077348 RepID=A0A2G8SUN1_9APHY|nr:hypothetical protein GSI_01180 [Ganoderma sinense ZZ0214-1]